MSLTKRPQLKLESLDDRIVPATLNLTTSGTEGTLNNVLFSQLDPGELGSDPTHTFVRLQESTILGSFFTPEEGYNTSARPLQYDATGNTNVTRSLLLSEVPLVTVGGVEYREFLLTVNQPAFSPNIDLQELRIFLSGNGMLSGYNTNTDRLAGLLPSYNLDSAGNHTVRINDNLNRTSSADVRVLIPATVFGSSDPDTTYVYVYSKFSALVGTTWLSGAESWAVREITPPPPPTLGSLAGRVFRDLDGDNVYDEGEGLGGFIITLSGVDAQGNNLYPDGDLTFTTGSDGSYNFSNLAEGTYFISVTEQSPLESVEAIPGTTSDSNTYGGDGATNQFLGIELSTGETGVNYDFRMDLDNT